MLDYFALQKIKRKPGVPIQSQLKNCIIDLIHSGRVVDKTRLPSTRALSEKLNISRNTVMIVYETLIEEGYLYSEDRRGYFVNASLLDINQKPASPSPEIAAHFTVKATELRFGAKPQNWSKLTYPFINGQIDSDHFPSGDWSSCMKIVCRKHFLQDWNTDLLDRDDQQLIDQLRLRILPERGILASQDEIIITSGSQHALFMIAFLLLHRGKTAGVENPGYIDFRNICRMFTKSLVPIPVDLDGLVIGKELEGCDLVCLTPSFQAATTVTMTKERRKALLEAADKHDFMVIEDDYESNLTIEDNNLKSLKSQDSQGRVIYTGSLSKTIAPGIRMGFIVAHRDIIREIRAIRRLNLRHPPLNNQRAVALFIAQGYYSSYIKKIKKVYLQRWELIKKGLKEHLPEYILQNRSFGGTSAWIKVPSDVDLDALSTLAEQNSLYFEDGRAYYLNPEDAPNYIKLGYSSIRDQFIDPGIKLIGKLAKNCQKPC